MEEILIEDGRAQRGALAGGEVVPADIVVSNADLPYTYKQADPGPVPARLHRRQAGPDEIRLLRLHAVPGRGQDLSTHMRHQALYFSEDYRANLDAIFRTKTLPEDPSFHMNNPTVTDPAWRRPGTACSTCWRPCPTCRASIDWDAGRAGRAREAAHRLERIVDPDIRQHIVWEREYRPADWQRDINAPYGVAFGSLSQGFFQSSYFRPHNKARDIRGLYFVGQGTYPGIGMPMVMLSARLVTERLGKDTG